MPEQHGALHNVSSGGLHQKDIPVSVAQSISNNDVLPLTAAELERLAAVSIRQIWMRGMGLTDDEIREACQHAETIDVDEEIEQLQSLRSLLKLDAQP
jgi:hypothetical protein